jgi:ParB-like chromosome segregation protein Spo0J
MTLSATATPSNAGLLNELLGRRNDMKKDIRKWKVKDLKPHPRQAEFFPDLPFHLLRDLAEDMKDRGQKEPLEILPDGTIVCGHQRTRAANYLGWDELDVWVNHELAAQGDLAVEQRLIEDNLARRQLDRLDQIRCYRRLNDLARPTPEARRRSHQLGRVRDTVGNRLGMFGRTLERYLRVLDAPREVQEAFQAGRISLVQASRVAGLPNEVQEQLVDDLRGGVDPKQAVAARLAGREPDPANDAVCTFVRSLERNLAAVEGYADQIRSLVAYDIPVLERAHQLIGQILRQVKGQKSPGRRGKQPRKRRP